MPRVSYWGVDTIEPPHLGFDYAQWLGPPTLPLRLGGFPGVLTANAAFHASTTTPSRGEGRGSNFCGWTVRKDCQEDTSTIT